MQTSGDQRREIAKLYPASFARRERPERSMTTDYAAAYWIASPSLAMTVDGRYARTRKCYPSRNSSYPFAATSSHLARYAGALPL